jgi:hypothetical protein
MPLKLTGSDRLLLSQRSSGLVIKQHVWLAIQKQQPVPPFLPVQHPKIHAHPPQQPPVERGIITTTSCSADCTVSVTANAAQAISNTPN